MYREDTIAAVATPPGEGGVGIVRVSGPQAERIGHEIFFRPPGKNGALRSHVLHYGTIRDPGTGTVLDQALLALMRKPRSYTGEDVVEFHCHGGPFLVRQVLGLILARGARQAEAGEFTRRAFLNGRLDLSQAEAVLDLIHARTEKAAGLAAGQLTGELSKWVGELRENLLDLLVHVEAAIDFPEEEIELLKSEELAAKAEALRVAIERLIKSYDWGRLFREGARVCIAGRPNVGKSSLLNALLGEERVIVTPVPGTTRDVIEETVNLGGFPTVFWDTAGIRESSDPVEKIGIGLSLKHLEASEAVVAVLDGGTPVTSEDESVLAAVRDKKGLIVINKIDLPQEVDIDQVKKAAPGKTLIPISATKGEGLSEFREALRALLIIDASAEPPMVITNARHKAALERAEQSLRRAVAALQAASPPEFVAVDLEETRESIEEIIGVITNDDVLERIFSKFCIGK